MYSNAFGKNWGPNPALAVLGTTNVLPLADKYETQADSFGMVVAKKLILLMWKSDCTPTYMDKRGEKKVKCLFFVAF